MFKKNVADRLSAWAEHRTQSNDSQDPFSETWKFWKDAPFVPYNHKVDPFNQHSWPTPWEIIVENYYDDFTKALMIGWSLKLTERFKKSQIEIRTLVDKSKNSAYNVIYVDEKIVINYNDNGPILAEKLPDSFLVENLVELKEPR